MSKLNPAHTKPYKRREEIGGVKRNYEEVVEEGRGPRVPRSKGPNVQGSQGPRVPMISKSHSNMCLTLKKVHLVFILVFK